MSYKLAGVTGCRVPGGRRRREDRGELPGGHTGYQTSPDRDLGVLITLEPPFKAFQRLTSQLSAAQRSLDENSGRTLHQPWEHGFFLPCPHGPPIPFHALNIQLVAYLKCLPFCPPSCSGPSPPSPKPGLTTRVLRASLVHELFTLISDRLLDYYLTCSCLPPKWKFLES